MYEFLMRGKRSVIEMLSHQKEEEHAPSSLIPFSAKCSSHIFQYYQFSGEGEIEVGVLFWREGQPLRAQVVAIMLVKNNQTEVGI